MDEQLPIHLATDASDYGIGAYLYQTKLNDDGTTEEIPVAFLSQALTKVQRRWSTIEKECYAIWYALRKWEHLLRDVHFSIHTDHRNLKFLNLNTPKVVRWKLAIQEFDFVVHHIEGDANVVADALSRLCTQDGEDDNGYNEDEDNRDPHLQYQAVVDPLCATTRICPCSVGDEAFLCGIASLQPNAQTTTPRGRKRKHSQSETALSHHSGLRENIEHHSPSLLPVQQLHNVVIPEEALRHMQSVHNKYVGHMGLRLTLKSKGLKWPNMRLHAQKFIAECDLCQKLKPINIAIKALPYVTAAPNPMERICIDTMGPLTKSAKGYSYILVVIDAFSRFVELYPCVSTTAMEAAERLCEHTGRYGTPMQILSDGGSQFLNDTVQALSKLLGVSYIKATPYSKEENGIVERANKEVLRHLRAFIADEKVLESWATYLPLIQRIMNSTKHSSLGVAPADIMFGAAHRLEKTMFYNLPNENYDPITGQPLPDRGDTSPILKQWLDNMLAVQHRLIQIAYQQQEQTQRKHILENTPSEAPQIFHNGDLVLCEYPTTNFGRQPPNKLLTPLRGPYRVVNFSPEKRQYTLQHLNINRTFMIDPSKVRPFQFDQRCTNPEKVALQDKQEFFVKAIHAARGNPKRKRLLSFLVEWEGYQEMTWEPWSYIRHNIVLHEYLRGTTDKDLRELASNI
jgi:transposase InsO family protein